MLRKTLGKAIASGVFSLAIVLASQAEAGWRWHGSSGGGWGGSSGGGSSGGWGGSSGGYGSSGGGWGGSSGGGGWGKHWHKKWSRWHGGGSSGGGWGGSSGGSSGGWGGSSGGSSGGWGGSSGGYGSSGGASYYAPGIDYGGYGGYGGYGETYPVDPSTTVPAIPATPEPPLPGGSLPGPSAPAPGAGAAPAETGMRRLDGLLAVNVPDDAKIYVNGQPTSSTGAARQYVSRDLQVGYNYNYEVRAEVVRDGRTVEQVKTVNLRAGDTARVAFDFAAESAVETSLTVHVPADAKVYLAGNATKASGETRVFRTTGLSGEKSWNDYVVRVEIERGGRLVSKEETISLKAGQSQELNFDFEADKVAAR